MSILYWYTAIGTQDAAGVRVVNAIWLDRSPASVHARQIDALVPLGLVRASPCGLKVHLTGLRSSPTRHAVVGFRFSGRLTQGPAVRVTDRRHSLRLDMLTMTRSAYVQVRWAVVALWCERHPRYSRQI